MVTIGCTFCTCLQHGMLQTRNLPKFVPAVRKLTFIWTLMPISYLAELSRQRDGPKTLNSLMVIIAQLEGTAACTLTEWKGSLGPSYHIRPTGPKRERHVGIIFFPML